MLASAVITLRFIGKRVPAKDLHNVYVELFRSVSAFGNVDVWIVCTTECASTFPIDLCLSVSRGESHFS